MVSESEQESKPKPVSIVETAFRQTTEIAKLAAALAKAQQKIKAAVRNTTNPHYKHKYADLAAVMDAVVPHLSANGVSVIQGAQIERAIREAPVYEPPRFLNLKPDQAAIVGSMLGIEMSPRTDEVEETTVFVTTRLMHESGQWIENECSAVARGSDPQAVGSVITYLKRYGLSAMTACAADEDDDGEASYGRRHDRQQEPKGKGASGKGNGAKKLAKKDVDAIVKAFETFKIPLAKLEEKLQKDAGTWTEAERIQLLKIHKEITDGTAAEDIFGEAISDPVEAKEEPGADG